MIVKAIFKDEKHDYFRDVQTKTKRVFGEIFECDDEIAEQRIEKGLVKKATKKEEKEYYDSIDTNDDETFNNEENKKNNDANDEQADNNKNNISENNDEPTKVKLNLNINVDGKTIANKIQQQNEK